MYALFIYLDHLDVLVYLLKWLLNCYDLTSTKMFYNESFLFTPGHWDT